MIYTISLVFTQNSGSVIAFIFSFILDHLYEENFCFKQEFILASSNKNKEKRNKKGILECSLECCATYFTKNKKREKEMEKVENKMIWGNKYETAYKLQKCLLFYRF